MAPTKKSETKPAAAPAPTAKKADAPSTKKVVEAAPVVAPTETPVVEVVAPTPSTLDEVSSKITALVSLLKETQSAMKALQKDYDRMKKLVDKTERKRANARSNPNGFAKPSKITEELCTFLGVAAGTEMSRTDVTRKVTAYIKENNLNKPTNRRFILPDVKLRKILGVGPEEEVSYFTLQRYLSRCFVKA